MSEEIIKSLDVRPLDKNTKDIAQRILDEQDIDKVKDLTNLFNLNSQKRNVMRVMKMNELLDKVTDKVVTRFDEHPDNFSNEDLLKFMQVTENAIDRANKQLNLIDDTPPIQLTQNNQVNINLVTELPRESRERVLEFVKNALGQNYIPEQEIIELKDEEIKDGQSD